ncbi:MAG: SGNH/GDSL hydrolase family protein [Nitrospira sp.]|nr:MAG: SGNH/GDSL hydrolase family protein [Nitrospira sp.]
MRLTGIGYPSFYQPDHDLGASLRPGAEGWWNREGHAYVTVNGAGLRDRDHPTRKPPGTFRIAVLGDSFAEAAQVSMEEAFWSVLERELAGCPRLSGRRPEVINFGVSGYGTAQELLLFRHRARRYDPDLVLLAFFTGNDVRNNPFALEGDDLKPYFVLQDHELRPDFHFRESPAFRAAQTKTAQWKHWILNQFRVYQVFDEARRIVRARMREALDPGEAGSAGNPNPWKSFAEGGLDALVYREPRHPDWKEAWEITERLLVRMRDEVKEQGAEFLVVTLSSAPQVHPDPRGRRNLADHLGVPNLLYPDHRIQALGTREDFPVFTLAPLLERYAEAHQEFLHFTRSGVGTGHWNREGHRLAGELIAQKVCANLPTTPLRS